MSQVFCHKRLIRNVASLPKHRSSASGQPILGHSRFSSFLNPHHPEVAPSARISQQKPDPQFFFFAKTLVICERPSNPVTIFDKILVLSFLFLLQLLTIAKSPGSPEFCNKSLFRSFSSLTKLWSSASARPIQRRNVTETGNSHFPSSAALTIPKAPSPAGYCNKSQVRNFALVTFSFGHGSTPAPTRTICSPQVPHGCVTLSTLDVPGLPRTGSPKTPDASRHIITDRGEKRISDVSDIGRQSFELHIVP